MKGADALIEVVVSDRFYRGVPTDLNHEEDSLNRLRPAGSIQVSPGYKFAVLAVSESRAGPGPSLFQPSENFAFTSGLPANALNTWLEDIGRFHRDELATTELFLWALRPSTRPDVIDNENRQLGRDVFLLYFGLLIAVPYFSHGRLTLVTGANSDGEARVRSLTTYARTYHTLGAPEPALGTSKFKLAGSLAAALKQHDTTAERERFDRSLRTFREASEAYSLDLRLHQFLRCAEGFTVPPNGVDFAARLSRLCKGRSKQHLQELYRIRSGIEHLHGPYSRLPKRLSKQGRSVRLLERCVEAEALSRFLLSTYLLNPQLWPNFRTRKTIQDFWKLKDSQLRRLWPTRLAFERILDEFNYRAVLLSEEEED